MDSQQKVNSSMDPEQHERMLNFLRMHKLREIATPILSQIFHARWAELMQIEQQNVGTSAAESQSTDGSKCGEKLVKICKTNGVSLSSWVMKEVLIGDTSNWDVSILANVIQAITKIILLKDPNAINYSAYRDEDTHINTIQKLRNKISHTSKSELTTQEFDPIWQQMTTALVMLGVSEMQLETVKAMEFAKPMKILTEAEKIKTRANEAFNNGKLTEAIELYSRILRMEGLTNDFQAIVYSNRSLAYLNRGNSVEQAIADARLAIHLRPTWERGYIRLGMAYKAKGELDKALDQLETAQTLNPNASDLREEISALRQKIGYQSRRDYATPHLELDTEEEQLEQVRQRLGMAPDAFQRLRERNEN